MELQHLHTFNAVAQAGSLTKAAQTLHLSQPAVSAQIKALEVEMGLALFHRTARGMELTDSGKLLLEQARDVVHRAQGVLRTAERLRGDVIGTLRLGTIDCGVDLKLARIIGQTTQAHPELDIQIIASNSGSNAKAVIDHEMDVAFVEGEVADDPRLRAWRIETSSLGVIGPAAWRDELADAQWPRLREFPWIITSPQCSYCVLLESLDAKYDLQLKPLVIAEAFSEVKGLVAEELGLSIADLDSAADLVEAGQLFVWPHFNYDMPVWLIASASRAEEPAIVSFVRYATAVHEASPRRKTRPLPRPGSVSVPS
ncbi:MAG: LysR family transcriptional regulator [Planctomycetota bacterium]